MYDAIIIGARCAGASTAMLLARRGYKVLLVDRDAFPSEAPRGNFINRHGPRLLKNWGLLDKVIASNCPAVVDCVMDFGDFPLTARNVTVDGVALGYAPRRKILDNLLVEAAIEAGAEFRQRFLVEDLLSRNGAITGIRGRQIPGGASVTEHARITIGADGRDSSVARYVHAPEYNRTDPLTCSYFSFWSGVSGDALEVCIKNNRAIAFGPTNDNAVAVFVAWPVEEFPAVKADRKGSFLRALEISPDLAERVAAGRQEERFYGSANLPHFLRKPFGPGWALVGDAGCHKDPILATGICDAFRDAELLVNALDQGFSGARPLQPALQDYEILRNQAVKESFDENIEAATLQPPPPHIMQLRAALRGNQEDINRFTMARFCMIPREEFFNQENIDRIMAAAAVTG